MGIVDFHSHFFSRPFFETLAAAAPGDETPEARLNALSGSTGIELPSFSIVEHTARWIAELDEHGVDHLCTFASVPEEAPAVAHAVSHSMGRISGFVLVDPTATGCAGAVERLVGGGPIRGVLLFPAMHHFDVGGPEAEPLLGVLNERGAILYVHCGMLIVKLRDLLGLPRPFDLSYANPLSIIRAANRHPKVRFVIPHFGAGFFRETLMAGAQCENVYVDTSSSNSWIRTQSSVPDLEAVFERTLRVFGPERVLFGTDSNVFPAGWRADRFDEQRAIADAIGMPEEHQALVFGGNAARLLGL